MFTSYAHQLANEVTRHLQPHCTRVDIAGNLRRGIKTNRAIAIACVPQRSVATVSDGDSPLFAAVPGFTEALCRFATKIENVPAGRLPSILASTEEGYQVTILFPEPRDYFRQLVISSSSAQYAADVLEAAWQRMGWVESDDGLRRRDQCVAAGSSWICHHPAPVLPPTWFSEADFYSWLRVQYEHPHDRHIHSPQKAAV